jgi:hypothetical protein
VTLVLARHRILTDGGDPTHNLALNRGLRER